MINLFAFTPKDQSLCYLIKIFGNMNGVIPQSPVGCGFDIAPSPLGNMFQVFNSVILAVGALILIYVTIVGVMATAHEGKFMGEKWNGLWTPLRMVIGIATLVPTGSGYSTIQIVMMWIIVQGIGAADTLWSAALNAQQMLGSIQGNPVVPTVSVSNNMAVLYQALVCDATSRETRPDPTGTKGGGYYCSNAGGGTYCSEKPVLDTTKTTMTMGPGGACGVLSYCNPKTACASDPNALKCLSCNAQIAALEQIVPVMVNAAIIFEKIDYSYRDFYARSYNYDSPDWQWIHDYCTAAKIDPKECCVKSTSSLAANQKCEATGPGNFPPPDKGTNAAQNASDDAVRNLYYPYGFSKDVKGPFVKTATSQYIINLNNAATIYIGLKNQPGGLDAEKEQARINGWILAGSYYYVLGKSNQSNLADASPPIEMPAVNLSSGTMSAYRNNYSAATVLISAANSAGIASGGSSGVGKSHGSSSAPLVGEGLDKMNESLEDVASAFDSPDQSKNINPIIQLQTAGFVMLMVAQIVFLLFLVLTFVLGITGNIDIGVLGTGVLDPIGPASILLYVIFAPLLFALLGFLISIGGMMAIYIPLIPFIVFTTGVIGWFISTIEAMVAGPLVALGILSPDAQGHELLGKAEPALGMIFNIFLRPSLMIFGLMAGMLLANVVVSLINWAFWNPVFVAVMGLGSNMAGAVAASVFNPVGFVIFLTAYVTFIVAALNKCFSAIHIIPSQVMTWISIQGSPGGAATGEDMLSEVKGSTGAAAGQAAGGMDSANKAGGRLGDSMNKDAKAQTAQFSDANLKGTGSSTPPPRPSTPAPEKPPKK